MKTLGMINNEYYDDTGRIEINTIGDFRSAIAYRVYKYMTTLMNQQMITLTIAMRT